MSYKNILVTGGAGFVGSNIAIKFKEHFPNIIVTAFDNLSRVGSELTLPRLLEHGVTFRHGDVRKREDLTGTFDCIIECSAEPSVMAGVTTSPQYLIQTNLVGAMNCFELAREQHADVVFLSTSRVYPVSPLNDLRFHETETRFELDQMKNGISTDFPLNGLRSLYGATKLAAELLIMEYAANYHLHAVIDRFGVIAGPWQMGKVDQGILALWVAHHVFKKPLSYIGFGGVGKQVRDILHIDDVFELLMLQLNDIKKNSNKVFNAGGGRDNSISLAELTKLCEIVTKNKITIHSEPETREGDVRIYITDNTEIMKQTGWKPKKSIDQIVTDTYKWIVANKNSLQNVFT